MGLVYVPPYRGMSGAERRDKEKDIITYLLYWYRLLDNDNFNKRVVRGLAAVCVMCGITLDVVHACIVRDYIYRLFAI